MAEIASNDKAALKRELANKKKRERMAALRRQERAIGFRVLTAKIHQVNYYAVQRILRDEENLSQFLALYTLYKNGRLPNFSPETNKDLVLKTLEFTEAKSNQETHVSTTTKDLKNAQTTKEQKPDCK